MNWPSAPHRTVSFIDVYDDVRRVARGEAPQRPANEFAGKIVLIGKPARVPVVIEQAALSNLTVFVNGGQRGLQIEIDPNDAAIAAGAVAHELTV